MKIFLVIQFTIKKAAMEYVLIVFITRPVILKLNIGLLYNK